MCGCIAPKALLNVSCLDDNAVGKLITGELAAYGRSARPLGTWDCHEDLVLRQDMAAPPMEPYDGTIALLRKARGLQVDARHADEDVAGSKPHHDGAI